MIPEDHLCLVSGAFLRFREGFDVCDKRPFQCPYPQTAAHSKEERGPLEDVVDGQIE